MVIEEDFHVLLEVVGVFAADGVDLVQQANGHSQSGAGLRAFDELLSDLHGVEDDALAGAGDVGEDLMFRSDCASSSRADRGRCAVRSSGGSPIVAGLP